MARRVGLFEHLSVEVDAPSDRRETRLTEADSETYDDDPQSTSLGQPSRDFLNQTTLTRVENETYDDDAGLGTLGISWTTNVETYVTKQDNETVDDSGSDMLSVPML